MSLTAACRSRRNRGEQGETEDLLRSRSAWCFRLPLVKEGVEWGWLNFYHNLDGEALLVDTNYLSNLFRREFTEAVARIMAAHESPSAVGDVSMKVAADEVGQ
jgi:hypothetical protein